ncbi:hypothetical protein G9P44_004597 [Scheffersomyces stipitis]|nr:hypothetical protein G9P44_004597 [Scheffersomyces stipitis]
MKWRDIRQPANNSNIIPESTASAIGVIKEYSWNIHAAALAVANDTQKSHKSQNREQGKNN